MEDPSGLFNSSLAGNVRRAIDLRQGDRIDEQALIHLIRAAVALNRQAKPKSRPAARPQKKLEKTPLPLRGINPQTRTIE